MSELEAFTPEPTFNTPEWVEWMQNRCYELNEDDTLQGTATASFQHTLPAPTRWLPVQTGEAMTTWHARRTTR
jgi:hypothetical protein